MTRPAESDGRLFYLLALYAALDQAVLDGDQNVAAIVEGFLPGTTGENQRGWSGNLREFLGGRPFPPVDQALSALVNIQDLTPSQLSRLVYVLGSLMHVPGRVGIGPEQFVEGLSLARPTPAPGTEPTPARSYATGGPDPGSQLFDVLQKYFNKQGDWHPATAYAVQIKCLDAIVASIPPCGACLTTQGNIECVVVDTRFESPSLTIEQVKAILDPRNWDKTAVLFFCSMQDLGTRQQPPYKDWGVVLETVSAWCGVIPVELKTELKYLKAAYSDGAVVQYDLNQKPPAKGHGDGQVTVDKGWLKVVRGTKTNSNAGVTVTTRKVVHITGLWPAAQKEFVCAMGYGDAARDMLLGGAKNPPKNLVPWSYPPAPLVSTQSIQAFLTAPPTGTQAVQPPPAPPVGDQPVQAAPESAASGSGAPPKTAAGLAVSMLSDCLAETANDSATLAAKFADKDLSVDDLVKFSAKLGARMASEPWRFLQKLSELPPTTPAGVPSKGDDGF
jgi:hypothetical protein